MPTDATAFAHRYASHNMMVMIGWKPDQLGEWHIAWVRRYWKTLAPYTQGFYVNEADDHTATVLNRNYQGNYPRLVKLKTRYDPANIFRLNANITPAA